MDERLIHYAYTQGIEVTTWMFRPPIRAMYCHLPGCVPVIGYHPDMNNDYKLFRTIFSEELGHHFTSAGHKLPQRHFNYSDRLMISKIEYQAMQWGAKFLISLEKLIQTDLCNFESVHELADHFDVTEDFMAFRLRLTDFQLYLTKTAGRRFCD